jgi:hypothetical protein
MQEVIFLKTWAGPTGVVRKVSRTLSACLAMAISFGSHLWSNDISHIHVGHTSSPQDLRKRVAHFCWLASANELCQSAMKLLFL